MMCMRLMTVTLEATHRALSRAEFRMRSWTRASLVGGAAGFLLVPMGLLCLGPPQPPGLMGLAVLAGLQSGHPLFQGPHLGRQVFHQGPPARFVLFSQLSPGFTNILDEAFGFLFVRIPHNVRRFFHGVSAFAQSLEGAEQGQALVGDEDLVVGTAADVRGQEVPDGLDPVAHLVLGGKPQDFHEFRYRVQGSLPLSSGFVPP